MPLGRPTKLYHRLLYELLMIRLLRLRNTLRKVYQGRFLIIKRGGYYKLSSFPQP
jgi:hypothetical protein